MQVKSNKFNLTYLKQVKNKEQRLLALENARLLSEFLGLGFRSFIAFYNIVTFYHPMYHNATGFIKLQAFWNLNNRDTDFNTIITNIIQKLTND